MYMTSRGAIGLRVNEEGLDLTFLHRSLGGLLSVLSGQQVLVVAPKSGSEAILEEFASSLGPTSVHVVRRPAGEPRSDDVTRIGFEFADSRVDGVVGIGGGSAIDFAKGLSVVMGTKSPITNFEFGQPIATGLTDVHAIPTISGSGSEVTPYAVLINSNTRRKFTLSSQNLIPKSAVLDTSLHPELPKSFRISAAIDAYCHALEAGCNAQATLDVVESASKVAAKLRGYLMENAECYPSEALTDASIASGRLITRARTGFPHTLAVAMAETSPAPHGTLVAVAALAYFAFDSGRKPDRLALVAEIAGLAATSEAEAGRALTDWFVPLFPPADLRRAIPAWSDNQRRRIVDRVLEDKGLPEVLGYVVNREMVTEAVGRVEEVLQW